MVYTRWGKSSCPSVSGTTLVYAGRTGGTWYAHKGGAVNYLCMPDDPDYLSYQPGVQGIAMCMEQSIIQREDHSKLLPSTMFPVLCAMLQQGWQSQWSQLKLSVHQHGLWSTLATSCQTIVIIIVPCMSVLTKILTPCQAVLLILMVLCLTMLKPTAMECCAHLMIHRKNSPVLFVPNKRH